MSIARFWGASLRHIAIFGPTDDLLVGCCQVAVCQGVWALVERVVIFLECTHRIRGDLIWDGG